MQLQSFKLIDFNPLPDGSMHVIDVPEGAVFKKAIVLPDGIYAFFLTPGKLVNLQGVEQDTVTTVTTRFMVIKTSEDVPKNAEFLDVLSEQFEMASENDSPKIGTLLFPLYLLT